MVLPNRATIDLSLWPGNIRDNEGLFRTICTPPMADIPLRQVFRLQYQRPVPFLK
jgi:hypothetical protein